MNSLTNSRKPTKRSICRKNIAESGTYFALEELTKTGTYSAEIYEFFHIGKESVGLYAESSIDIQANKARASGTLISVLAARKSGICWPLLQLCKTHRRKTAIAPDKH